MPVSIPMHIGYTESLFFESGNPVAGLQDLLPADIQVSNQADLPVGNNSNFDSVILHIGCKFS